MEKWRQMAQELLSWLQEMEAADDLQEAFDVAEVLSDVLTDGTQTAEQFVMEAEALRSPGAQAPSRR